MATLHAVKQVVTAFEREYAKTPAKLKVLDTFSALALAAAAIQFVYALLVGTFPFNAFLAGFFCCIGAFVLTVCLRISVDITATDGSTEKAFTDYAIVMCILFLAALNYAG